MDVSAGLVPFIEDFLLLKKNGDQAIVTRVDVLGSDDVILCMQAKRVVKL